MLAVTRPHHCWTGRATLRRCATPQGNSEPASSSVKAAASKNKKDDEDDQKRGAVHGDLLAETDPNRSRDLRFLRIRETTDEEEKFLFQA